MKNILAFQKSNIFKILGNSEFKIKEISKENIQLEQIWKSGLGELRKESCNKQICENSEFANPLSLEHNQLKQNQKTKGLEQNHSNLKILKCHYLSKDKKYFLNE